MSSRKGKLPYEQDWSSSSLQFHHTKPQIPPGTFHQEHSVKELHGTDIQNKVRDTNLRMCSIPVERQY